MYFDQRTTTGKGVLVPDENPLGRIFLYCLVNTHVLMIARWLMMIFVMLSLGQLTREVAVFECVYTIVV